MECPNCQAENPEQARYCNNCGWKLDLECTNCGASLQPGARFCQNCGHPAAQEISTLKDADLQEKRAPTYSGEEQPALVEDFLYSYIPKELLKKLEAARSSHMMVGERRIVTILFCDVKGSTEAASKLDPEEWAEIINGAFAYMIQPIYRYEGTVARLMGDGLLAFFGAPIAHEDDPQRAILAGLAILAAIQDYGAEIKSRWGIDFEVRIGINTGLVVVGAVGSDLRMEYSALGDAINIAARMEQTAQPGSIQIAEDTYKLVAPLFEVEPVEDLKVKGHEEMLAYRVLGQKDSAGSLRGMAGLYSPMVGRQRELDILESALKAMKEGVGGWVAVIGEAGLGKSRLIEEFRQRSAWNEDSNISWMLGKVFSYDAPTPFALFSNLFYNFFQPSNTASDQERYEQVAERIESLDPGSREEMAPFFATLLGIKLENEAGDRVKYLEPVHLRGLIFEKVKDLLSAKLTSSPVILFLDDLHWADPTSLELLASLLPLTYTKPLLVITATRPQKQSLSWEFHRSNESSYRGRFSKILLDSLDENQARSLIANLLKIEDLPEEVRHLIFEKAEGNPFYMEEVIRSLLDKGLVVKKDGHWQATKEIHSIALPDTLAGLITARLDRLNEPSRHILQAAAVIGREFTIEALAGVVDNPDQVEPSLAELKRWELLLESRRADRQAYIFRHVLTQDAAYNSILLSNRRELHRRTAEALMQANPGAYGEIARHLVEARQMGKAVPYLVQAGEQAARAYAVSEAEAYFQQSIDLLLDQGDPALLRRAYEGLGGVYQFSNRYPQAQDTYTKMLSLAESLGDIPMQISAMNKLAGVMALGLGNFTQAEQFLDQAEKLSRSYGELASIPENSLLRCQICTIRADFDQVVFLMDEVVRIGQELGKQEDMLLGLVHVATSLVFLTRFEEAQVKAEQALKVARESGDKEHEAYLLAYPLPMCYLRNGDFEEAHRVLEEALAIAEKIGLLSAQAEAGYLLTEISRWQGEYEKALYYGRKSLKAVLPLEPYMPFEIVPILGSLGMVYLEISEEFSDAIHEFHDHALLLLESPVGKVGGGTAWSDLALCALKLRDIKIAEEAVHQGLNYPNMYMRLERPRHLAAAALLALNRGENDEAVRLAEEACAYAEQRGLLYLYPLLYLVQGEVLTARGDTSRGDMEDGIKSLSRAEKHAMELGMRPVIWQSRAAAADALVGAGRTEQAVQILDEAKAAAREIAELFEDQNLRRAYQRNISQKLAGSFPG